MNHLFPSAITPANVLDTQVMWWLRFAGQARAHARHLEEQKRKGSRGGN